MAGNRNGMALVLTLWILAVLIVLAAGLAMTAHTEAQVAGNFAGDIRCRLLARGGVNAAIAKIEETGSPGSESNAKISSADEELDLDGGAYDVSIEDEAGKVNINTAPEEMLEALFGSKDIAEAIIDWRDSDDQPLPSGAESQYYSGLEQPYRSKNAPFYTVRELLLVKGVSPDVLDEVVTSDGRKLEDILTVYSHDNNLDSDGNKRLNLKTASRDEIKSKLGDVLTDRDIEAITRWRNRRSVKSVGEIAQVPRLRRDKVEAIYDRLTVSDAETVDGLVNINTAPAEVLAAVQGLDADIAGEIVAYREGSGQMKSVGDLLSVNGLDNQRFAKAADYLTARSRVHRIVSDGRITREQTIHSIVCVVDVSGGKSAEIRYWRE